jgi:hypothetical protein
VSGSGKGSASPGVETPEGLRAMALHAVRLAVAIPSDPGAKRFLEFGCPEPSMRRMPRPPSIPAYTPDWSDTGAPCRFAVD